MARRKKEQKTKGKASSPPSRSPSEENVGSNSRSTYNADDDGGNSSLDESAYEDSEMLKPEDIQSIVIGDLKTVCVTKATSDDENDALSKRYSNTAASMLSEPSKVMPVTQPPPPPPPETRAQCEHPKKKIVRLMNAAQFFKQDITESWTKPGTTIIPAPVMVKSEPKEEQSTYLNAVSMKCNGELSVNELRAPGFIKSESFCDAKPSPNDAAASSGVYGFKSEDNSRVKFEASPPCQPIENNVSDERDSYQDISELIRKSGPLLRDLANNLQEAEFCSNFNRPPVSMETDQVPYQSTPSVADDEDYDLRVPEDGPNTPCANSESDDQLPRDALSMKLSSVTIDCDASQSTIAEAKESTETSSGKSSPDSKRQFKITMFDFLSFERCGKPTKVENVDELAYASHKSTKSLETSKPMNKSSDESVDNEQKNHVVHEKPKTDVKPKKSEEKTKKSAKKESNNKQGKRSVDNKALKEDKEKKEAKEQSAAEKRRRSVRLKSKPEYEKYEESSLLLAAITPSRENNGAAGVSGVDGVLRNENKEVTKPEVKNGEVISAKISVDLEDLPAFEHIMENEYHTERSFSKDAERMICDCVLTKEEIIRGESGCGEDCLNRLLLIECCSRCTLGDRCTNKRFQNREYAQCEVFRTSKKGNGLKVLQDIPSGTFIMEYVGEVIDSDEFERRAMEYAHKKIPHFYFMSLKADCIIDATIRGNCSRFINHSCEPNAETQKWTVQGELRIGFFSKRPIMAGEEITFDYQLQRYGKQAQRCYCETPSCTGWIGEDPDKQQDDDKPSKDKKKKKHRDQFLDLETALDEISQVGLINRHQTLSLNRLMVHAKELPVRMQILQLIEEGHPACRRLFVDYHGLPIIWSWMVDCTAEHDELKLQLLKTLMALPITNKTILVDSKVYSLVEQWAFAVDQKIQSEALSAQSVLESVEDIATADETPVSEMAQKVLNQWTSLREAYRIPKKERIQQMKEHEREADQNVVKLRPRRLPLYAEKMRDRYHRNRYNRDKEFDKVYFDRWKSRDSPDSRDRKPENAANRISKMERRYMFEMKVAREKEEKEMLKRQKEEEEKYWNSVYYANQQHQMMASGYPSAGQYVAAVPTTPYSSDPVSQAVASQLMQSISSISSANAAASNTHPYYPAASSYISQSMMLPHLAASQASTPHSHSQTSTPSVLMSQQVSPSAAAQSYYQNSAVYSSSAASYAHQTVTEQAKVEKTAATAYASYDYQAMSSPSDADAVASAYAGYNENSFSSNAEPAAATYTASDSKAAAALANAATAAVDITKIELPPKWKAARDAEGRIYYYHTKTRISQWYPPAWEEPQQVEEVEQSDADDSSDEESSAGEEEDDEFGVSRKRRHQSYEEYEAITKRRFCAEELNFDMDAELKENLAAMSSEFQDSDNEDYSPKMSRDKAVVEDQDEESQQAESTPSASNVPLITEHIISPREPVDKEERIRNKKRIKSLKEKLRRQKRQQKLAAVEEGSSAGSGRNGSGGGNNNGGVNSISSSNNLLSVPADTSSITDRKRKDAFRSNMANFVVHCLNPYFRSSCTSARITNYNDFKHLARKLTHFVMLKELKHCRSATDLTCNSSVKHKAKEYIRKYMSKFGEVYVRPPDDNINY